MHRLSTFPARVRSAQRLSVALAAILLLLSAVPALATGFYKDFVVINNGGSSNYYQTNITSAGAPQFQGAYLGEFDRGTGVLTLGGEANTFTTNGDDVQPPQLFYRVYMQGTTPGDFAPLNLGFERSGDDGNAGNEKWSNNSTMPSLLAATNGSGTYTLEVFFQGSANYSNNGGSGSFPFFDSRNGYNYQANFKVVGSVPVKWNGSASNSWFDARNWTPNAVPSSTTDVTIPYAEGSVNPPTINFNNAQGQVAQVRTLTLLGNTDPAGTTGQTLLQDGSELQLFGDFNNNNNAYRQTGGIFTLAGIASQTFDGSSFFDVHIQGGSRKTLRGRMDVSSALTFVNGGGILITRTDNTSSYSVDLINNASIVGETDNSYVLGVLRNLNQTLAAGGKSTFGNIGLELTVISGTPGKTFVTRITGPDSFSYYGVGTSHSIRRGFVLQPDNPTGNTYDIVFHYLRNELQSIPESNLKLFRSNNGVAPFEDLGGTVNTDFNTVTRTGITSNLAATFTLGDRANPLPVTLTSFTATGTAQGAALKWVTASELNNKGFGIERQLAGATTWESVGYVAGTNAANGSTYSYLDKTLPASATQVYYRLRQEDLSGVLTYSPVAAISHTAAAGAALTLSPVPLDGSPLQVAFAEAGQAGATIDVVNMQGQRVLHFTSVGGNDGAVSLPLGNLAPGVYVVNVQVAGQADRHARFVKQ